MDLEKLMAHITIIPDYRQSWKVEHKLSDILLLTICAVDWPHESPDSWYHLS